MFKRLIFTLLISISFTTANFGDDAALFPTEIIPLPVDSVTSNSTGDFNGDGLVDLAVANDAGISILLNEFGDFPTNVFSSLAVSGPQHLLAEDFDSDGNLDLAFELPNGQIGVSLGNGDGTLSTVIVSPVGAELYSIAAADFNGDGQLDLAAPALNLQEVRILLGNGDGSFSSGSILSGSLDYRALELTVLDFDDDGNLDLAWRSRFSDDSILVFGDGTGDFDGIQNIFVGSGHLGLAAEDTDGDGVSDLAIATTAGRRINVVFGNSDRSFDNRQLSNQVHGGTVRNLSFSDIDLDGIADLTFSSFSDFNVLAGRGDGRFVDVFEYQIGSTDELADFNNDDGALDVYRAFGSTGRTALNNGDGTFPQRVSVFTQREPAAVLSADFDRDGISDLLIFGTNFFHPFSDGVFVFRGQADGNFEEVDTGIARTLLNSGATGDFNGDGLPDFALTQVFSDTPGPLTVFLGNGDLTFTISHSTHVGNRPLDTQSGDFDGDGILDLATCNRDSQDVSILFGSGDGTFSPTQSILVNEPIELSIADFNNDGRDDLAVQKGAAERSISILLSEPNGSFTEQTVFNVPGEPVGYLPFQSDINVVASDINGDNAIDLIMPDRDEDRVVIFKGLGNGSFETAEYLSTGEYPRQVSTADLNSDGLIDIATSNLSDSSVFLNSNNQSFQTKREFSTNGRQSLHINDFTGDGFPDLAFTSIISFDLEIHLLENLCRPTSFLDLAADGVLTVTGSAENDDIEVTKTGISTVVNFNSESHEFFGVQKVVIFGAEGDDTITVDGVSATVFGEDGDDEITCGVRDDFIDGGDGADVIFAGPGNDVVLGGDGADTIQGNNGDDFIQGGDGGNTLFGGGGDDEIIGGLNADFCSGGAGDDHIEGGDGEDVLFGGVGDDYIHGGPGNDVIRGFEGRDELHGFHNSDQIFGGRGADRIYGENGGDFIFGEGGNDRIYGGTSRDEISGGAGRDEMFGEDGDDLMFGNGGADEFTGGNGLDEFIGGAGIDTAHDKGEAGETGIENS